VGPFSKRVRSWVLAICPLVTDARLRVANLFQSVLSASGLPSIQVGAAPRTLASMFTVEDRDRLRNAVLEIARTDSRVVAAAEVGSLAAGQGDRWSDIDLTFAVDDSVAIDAVLRDWTSELSELDGVELFDLTVGAITYRIFMFPDCLQLDVSFTLASAFRPTGPRFSLIFGDAGDIDLPEPPPASGFIGWAILYARHARVCIERGLWWQAEHCVSNLRQNALSFACLRRGLPATYGRGLDQLPPDVQQSFAPSLAVGFDVGSLKRALIACVTALASELDADPEVEDAIRDRLLDSIAGI